MNASIIYNLTILDFNFEAVVDNDYTSLREALHAIAHHQDTRGYGAFYVTVGKTGIPVLEGKTHSYPRGKHATLTRAQSGDE